MGSDTNWMDLALMWWAQRGQNGSTPNFYNIPLTPEQKRWEDERWRLYQAGGSEQAKAVGSAGMQYLGGLQQGPSNFSFMSPAMQGQTFAGGFQMPKIDISQFQRPQPGTGNSRPTPPTNPNTGPIYPGAGGRPTTDQPMGGPWSIGGGTGGQHGGPKHKAPQESTDGGPMPGMYRDLYDMAGSGGLPINPQDRENLFPTTGGPNDPNRPGAPGSRTEYGDIGSLIPDNLKERAKSAWQEFTTKYPDWQSRGTAFALQFLGGALGGPGGALAGGLVAKVFRWLYGSGYVATPQQGQGGGGGVIPGSMNNGINNALGGNQ